jgi:hypothetical protein
MARTRRAHKLASAPGKGCAPEATAKCKIPLGLRVPHEARRARDLDFGPRSHERRESGVAAPKRLRTMIERTDFDLDQEAAAAAILSYALA